MREERRVDALEFVDGEMARGAVFDEALVPLLELVFVELCTPDQVLDDLRPQLAVGLTHRVCAGRGGRGQAVLV